jgi:N-methylhydantoinase B
VRIDLSNAPDAQPGPTNCPFPTTVSGARIAIAMLAGTHEIMNEGHFRPIELLTRPGSMLHPIEPQPCFLYAWPVFSVMEGIYQALSQAAPGFLPSGSAGDICGVDYYGYRTETGEPFMGFNTLPVGHGGHARGDGPTMFIAALAHAQLPSPELQEAKLPILYEKWEFTPDSAGPGEHRGGLGWELHFRLLNDIFVISEMERTKRPGWAQAGGLPGASNRFEIDFPNGKTRTVIKATDLPVPEGSRLRIYCGGGGGYGDPRQRDPSAIELDLRDGLVTQAHVEQYYRASDRAGPGRLNSKL